MPCWYWLTGLIYVVLFYVTKYRKKVVYTNLKNAFPQKTPNELNNIARTYYRYLGQMMIENLYLRVATPKNLPYKINVKNPELLNQYYQQQRSGILMFGHNGNWEYSGALVVHTPYLLAPVYKRLSNKTFDAFYYNMRHQYGVEPIEMRDVVRRFTPLTKKQPTLLFMLADQSPMKHEIHHWVPFLNQPTGVYLGSEKLAKKMNLVVFYCEITLQKKGIYQFEFKLITDNAPATPDFYITNTFFAMLESSIHKQPAYWLWSHRRWKHTPDNSPNPYQQ